MVSDTKAERKALIAKWKCSVIRKLVCSFLLETTLAWPVVSADLQAPDPQIIWPLRLTPHTFPVAHMPLIISPRSKKLLIIFFWGQCKWRSVTLFSITIIDPWLIAGSLVMDDYIIFLVLLFLCEFLQFWSHNWEPMCNYHFVTDTNEIKKKQGIWFIRSAME